MDMQYTTTVSLTIENDLLPSEEAEFKQWQAEIKAAASQFPGYLDIEIFTPVSGLRDKWYTIIHFDSPENLTAWLESEIRHNFIQKRPKQLGNYRFIHYQTGLEPWCGKNQQNLPLWKQALLVLSGLYPTLILQRLFFQTFPILSSFSLGISILINSAITCSLLTWLVMPLARKIWQFWLKPKTKADDFLGSLLIIISLLIINIIFSYFSDSY